MKPISKRQPSRSLLYWTVACACLAGGSVAPAAQAENRAAPRGPNGAEFYDPPPSLHPGKHGDLIWATEIKSSVSDSRAWKILYWSTTIDDRPVPVSGILIAPNGSRPADGRPVVSWGHGTTGVPRNCAPSMVNNPARDASFYFLPNGLAEIDFGIPGLSQMMAAGYAVVATDYNGLGAPGIHHYLIGRTEARNLLDAAVAARQLPAAGAGRQAIVIGWSQGGQAAIWAAQLADYVADTTNVLGAAALAPVNAMEQIKSLQRMEASGRKVRPVSAIERVMAWYAMTVVFPELALSDVLTPAGLQFFADAVKAGQCNHHMGDSFAYTASYKGALTRDDPANQEAWRKRYEENSLGTVSAKVPVAVYQGDDDDAVDPAATQAYVDKACASGATLSYSHYAATDHIRLSARALPDFMSWMANRFSGKPAPTTCREAAQGQPH